MAAKELIATVTVGSGGATSIDFTSIPGTYTDLVLVYALRSTSTTSNGNIVLSFNGILTNYTERLLYGNGSTVGTAGQSASGIQFLYSNRSTDTASTFSNGQIYITRYASSSSKPIGIEGVVENNATTASNASLTAAVWNNSAAITSIKLDPEVGDLVQYSTATLYGITKGSGGATVS